MYAYYHLFCTCMSKHKCTQVSTVNDMHVHVHVHYMYTNHIQEHQGKYMYTCMYTHIYMYMYMYVCYVVHTCSSPEISTCCVGDMFTGREIQISEVRTVSTETLGCLVTNLEALVQYQLINVATVSGESPTGGDD